MSSRGTFLKQGFLLRNPKQEQEKSAKATHRVSPRGKGDGLHVMVRYDLQGGDKRGEEPLVLSRISLVDHSNAALSLPAAEE